MTECVYCNSQNPIESKFCIMCGRLISFAQQCNSCHIKLPLIAKFCHQCGGKVQNESENTDSTSDKPSKSKNDSNNTSTSGKKRKLSDEIKVRVDIISGDKMKLIKTENGGGWRQISFKSNDDYHNVFKKILQMYFPSDKVTKLGHRNEYIIRLLDFNQEKIQRKTFTTLEDYIDKCGIKLRKLFFLQLWPKLISVPLGLNDFNEDQDATTSTINESLTEKNKTNKPTFSPIQYTRPSVIICENETTSKSSHDKQKTKNDSNKSKSRQRSRSSSPDVHEVPKTLRNIASTVFSSSDTGIKIIPTSSTSPSTPTRSENTTDKGKRSENERNDRYHSYSDNYYNKNNNSDYSYYASSFRGFNRFERNNNSDFKKSNNYCSFNGNSNKSFESSCYNNNYNDIPRLVGMSHNRSYEQPCSSSPSTSRNITTNNNNTQFNNKNNYVPNIYETYIHSKSHNYNRSGHSSIQITQSSNTNNQNHNNKVSTTVISSTNSSSCSNNIKNEPKDEIVRNILEKNQQDDYDSDEERKQLKIKTLSGTDQMIRFFI